MKKHSDEKFGLDCGVDEAGRGPLAGPVVAAAVILPETFETDSLNDSKQLSSKNRDLIFDKIVNSAVFGVGFASVYEIDKHNVLQATFLAMRRAIDKLKIMPSNVFIDGNIIPPNFPYRAKAIVGGDRKLASIAAASVVAKVTRDSYMIKKAKIYPEYGWEKNFGYGVKKHFEALKQFGVTPEHRRSFAPIHNMLC